MTNAPKTIKIFLLSGKSSGARTVELSAWNGKGYVIPRSDLSEILKREELLTPSIYFLVGENEQGEQMVYVGESNNFIQRIQYHNRDANKDFWNTAICFVSKDETLNKAYIGYLESILLGDIKKAGRVKVEAGKDSLPDSLSESDRAEANEFAENIRTLLPIMGFNFLKKPTEDTQEEVWYCKGKDADAQGVQGTEGFVVLKGSTIQGSEASSINEHIKRLRREILSLETIESGAPQTLIEDTIFNSPSAAAAFVLGRRANGWTEWKNEEGKTLDEVKRK